MKIIRTYMSFTQNIDPAHILTMSDLELSIALASTLVRYNENRQLVAGLADRWKFIAPNKVEFHLRSGLKWSDESPITAFHYHAALERARRDYPSDLKALFETLHSFEALDDLTLVFTTRGNVAKSGIVLKLTEPMYGLVSVHNGQLDMRRSAGPFCLEKHSKDDVVLSVNKNWFLYELSMPDQVEIRQPPNGNELLSGFVNDDWPNLVSGSSLASRQVMEKLTRKGCKAWQRSMDKVFSLYPSKRFLEKGGAAFIRYIASKIEVTSLLEGLDGYAVADQFFPRGYELWSENSPKVVKSDSSGIGKIKVLIPDGSQSHLLARRLKEAIQSSTRRQVVTEIVSLAAVDNRMRRGDYDVLAASVAVADPNFEGASSFFFEREPPFIQSSSSPYDFARQLREVRGLPLLKDRAARVREIFASAQANGHVLPLFHFSSLAVAKPGLDLSQIPNSDETVIFSKVRME